MKHATRTHRSRRFALATSAASATYRDAAQGPTQLPSPAINAAAASVSIGYWLATAVNPVPDEYWMCVAEDPPPIAASVAGSCWPGQMIV